MLKRFICVALLTFAAASRAEVIENFDDISNLAAKGFILRNASAPGGANGFFQGTSRVFSAQSGADNAYLGANYDSATAGGLIDDWLISPEFSTRFDGTISFYIRGAADAGFSDTFQYGVSNGGSNAGDFMLTSLTAVPTDDWTRYNLHFTGTGMEDSVGRFAIRYTGAADNSDYIGIDSLTVALPEPGSLSLLALGMTACVVGTRRRKAT